MIPNLVQQDKKSKLSALRMRMYIALLSDCDIDNFPKPINSTIMSNVLLPGKKHSFFDAKIGTILPSGAAGESLGNTALTVSPQLEGISRKTLQFLSAINGERFIIFWENCDTGEKYIAGNPCSGGMLAVVTNIGRQDDGFNGVIIEFRGGECPDPYYFYEGPIILDTPKLVAADSTTFPLSESYQYQLAENTSNTVLTDITNVTDDEVGRIVELIGGGINFPTVINPTSKFILRNGVDWIGTLGSRITLQIVKTGLSAFAFFEIHRA